MKGFCYMKHSDSIVLKKIIGYCDDINMLLEKYYRSFDNYESDISFQYSCNMCIIQIGELVCRLSDELIESAGNIPWREIKGMRNIHAHDYENVDLEIVWKTLNDDIPDLRMKIAKLIEDN